MIDVSRSCHCYAKYGHTSVCIGESVLQLTKHLENSKGPVSCGCIICVYMICIIHYDYAYADCVIYLI